MRRWIRSWAAVLTVGSVACQGSEAGDTVTSEAGAMSQRATIPPGLQEDLDRLGSKGIPVDIVFEQGMDVLGAGR